MAVSGSTVALSGQVKARLERHSAVKSAWTVAGVTEVGDEISVV
jgi:osmotically-inducible protein OsmY